MSSYLGHVAPENGANLSLERLSTVYHLRDIRKRPEVNIELLPESYRIAIESMLRLEGLSPETVAAICEPQVLFLTEEYRKAPVRVMIVGQETRDAEKWLNEAVVEGGNAMIERQRQSFEKYDFAIAGSHDNNPFWRGYDDVCEAFGLSSRRATAWTNVSKVQLGKAIDGSFSISKLSSPAQMQIIRWQRAMARAEIEYARPDIIVWFTGGMRWMIGHLYKTNIEMIGTDVGFHSIEGAADSTGYVSAPFLGDAISVFTYHPHAGRRGDAKLRTIRERAAALQWASDRYSNDREQLRLQPSG